jgi:hypothetical protein
MSAGIASAAAITNTTLRRFSPDHDSPLFVAKSSLH